MNVASGLFHRESSLPSLRHPCRYRVTRAQRLRPVRLRRRGHQWRRLRRVQRRYALLIASPSFGRARHSLPKRRPPHGSRVLLQPVPADTVSNHPFGEGHGRPPRTRTLRLRFNGIGTELSGVVRHDRTAHATAHRGHRPAHEIRERGDHPPAATHHAQSQSACGPLCQSQAAKRASSITIKRATRRVARPGHSFTPSWQANKAGPIPPPAHAAPYAPDASASARRAQAAPRAPPSPLRA